MANMDLSKLLEAQIKEQARALIEPFITKMEEHINSLVDKWDDTAEQLFANLTPADKPKRKRTARKAAPAGEAGAAGTAEAPGTRPQNPEAVEAVKLFAIGDRVQAKQGRGTFQGTVKATVPETGEVSIEKDGGAGLVLRYAHRVEKLVNGANGAVAPAPAAQPAAEATPAAPATQEAAPSAPPAPEAPQIVEHAATPASPGPQEVSTPPAPASAPAGA